MATGSKTKVCGLSPAEIVGSNLTEGLGGRGCVSDVFVSVVK